MTEKLVSTIFIFIHHIRFSFMYKKPLQNIAFTCERELEADLTVHTDRDKPMVAKVSPTSFCLLIISSGLTVPTAEKQLYSDMFEYNI